MLPHLISWRKFFFEIPLFTGDFEDFLLLLTYIKKYKSNRYFFA